MSLTSWGSSSSSACRGGVATWSGLSTAKPDSLRRRSSAGWRRSRRSSTTACWFRDIHTPRGRGTIRTRTQRLLELTQHPGHPILVLHKRQGHPIDPGRSPVRPDPSPRLPRNVTSVDTVIQGVETLAAVHSRLWSSRTFTAEGSFPSTATTGCEPSGVVGPSHPGPALTLTSATSVTKVGALPSRRVLLHADHRYYDPVGLPLHSARFHHRLIRPVSARQGVRRRASPVPCQTVCTCRRPYPGETPPADPGTGPEGHGLRRDMSGSDLRL